MKRSILLIMTMVMSMGLSAQGRVERLAETTLQEIAAKVDACLNPQDTVVCGSLWFRMNVEFSGCRAVALHQRYEKYMHKNCAVLSPRRSAGLTSGMSGCFSPLGLWLKMPRTFNDGLVVLGGTPASFGDLLVAYFEQKAEENSIVK